jgi:hypothetical protein
MAHAQRKKAEGRDRRKLDSRLHLTEEIVKICREIAFYGGSDIAKDESTGTRVVSYGRPSSEQISKLKAMYAPLYLKSMARYREITIRYHAGFPGSWVELLVDGKKALEARFFTLSGSLVGSKIDDGLVTPELLDQLLQLRSLVEDAERGVVIDMHKMASILMGERKRSNVAKKLSALEKTARSNAVKKLSALEKTARSNAVKTLRALRKG